MANRETRVARPGDTLRETETVYSRAFHYSPLGMAVVGTDGAYLRVNPSLCESLGYSEKEMLSKTYQDITYPEDREISGEYRRRLLSGEVVSCSLEKRCVHAKGYPVWMSVSATLVRNPEGAPLYFVVQHQDITERKKREEDLRESRATFAAAFENAAIGMSLVNPEGRWLRVNRALCRITGYSEEELLRKRFQDITHPGDIEQDLFNLRRLLAGEIPSYQVEKRYFHKRGHIIWIMLTTSLVRDARGEPLYLVSQVQDITERKVSEQALKRLNESLEARNRELMQKNEEIETFIYSASHDLRAPLVNLLGFSEELELVGKDLREILREDSLSPKIRERGLALVDEDMATSVRFIRAGVTRLGGLIDGLLRLSRAGRAEHRRERIELNALVRRVVNSMSKTIAARDAVVLLKELPPVWGDPPAIEQVFAGLIDNALNYLDPSRRGIIEVGYEHADGCGRYYVRDNGLGIPEQGGRTVFQAFWRLHPGAVGGEGVGLALVQRIVERHGGRVWFESTEGEGSTFFVELPGEEGSRITTEGG